MSRELDGPPLEHDPDAGEREGAVADLPDRVLRIWEVEKMLSLSRHTIYRMEKRGTFPRRRQLSPGATGHLLSEVLAWLRSRPEAGPP